MAILRGGRRIGNFDIRLGIPRDRSLDNVAGDARLKRKPGNPETTIGRFMAAIGDGEGFARPNRYLVRIFPPKKQQLGSYGVKSLGTTYTPFGDAYEAKDTYTSSEMTRNVAMMCNTVTLPNRDVNTTGYNTYGPKREMPYAYSYSGNIQMNFFGDKYLRQRHFFEEWQKLIFDIETHDMNFYDGYIGTMDIYQLGSMPNNADRDRITYAIRLYEVYPQTIGSIEYSYSANDSVVNVPVTLNFRHWRNLLADEIDGATIGNSSGEVPTIKASKDFGLFGGILNKLPPELRRAGRDILNTTKRSLPIGKITGGRVFPPLT